MAKRGHSRNPGYESGQNWEECYSCGFEFKKKDLRKTWDNKWVDNDCWEHRHDQDFLRVKAEKIAVDDPGLMESPITAVTATVDGSGPAVMAETFTVPTGTGFNNGT